MRSKPSSIDIPEEPGEAARRGAADFLNRPEFVPVVGSTKRHRLIVPLLIILVLILLGAGGFEGCHYYFTRHSEAATANTPAQAKATDPYSGWKTYASDFDSFSFRYPSNWTTTPSTEQFGITGSDSLRLKSPSGALTVSWWSAVQGIGGACDDSIMPGTHVNSGGLGPCPYWYVLDKQKLAGADLYFVAGVETADGTTYSPWCGVQSATGITKSKGNIGYMLFQGHHDIVMDGHDDGLNQAGLVCSGIPGNFGGIIQSVKGSKALATAYMSTPEFQQAKLMLLSLKDLTPMAPVGWKTYTSNADHFSIAYPPTWTLDAHNAHSQAVGYDSATLTSPSGTELNLYADQGGKGGGPCIPNPQDVPFRKGNACSTFEYLTSELLPVHNMYYMAYVPHTSPAKFVPAPALVYLVTSHSADTNGVSSYGISVAETMSPQTTFTLNTPYMGASLPYVWLTPYNAYGHGTGYIYVYANGSSSSFLTNTDATTIKDIIRTLQLSI